MFTANRFLPLLATVFFSLTLAAENLPKGWTLSPFSQFDPTPTEQGIRLQRDANLQANPPGVQQTISLDNPRQPFRVIFRYTASPDALPVCRVRTPGNGTVWFWRDGRWSEMTYQPFQRYFESNRTNDVEAMTPAINLRCHTLIAAAGQTDQTVELTVEPYLEKNQYLLEFYNAGAGSELLLHEVRVEEYLRESDPAEWAALRRTVGIPPDSDINRDAPRQVLVHVVPWLPPHRENRRDLRDPERNYSLLCGDEADPQTRIDAHLLTMRAAGIDIVALDSMVRTGWHFGSDPAKVLWHENAADLWLDAMRRLAPEMRFCIQLDRAGGQSPSAEVWPAAIDAIHDKYASHPNYYRVDGRPVLLTFWINEKTSDAEWREIRARVTCDFLIIGSILENPGSVLAKFTRPVVNLKRVGEALELFDGLELCPLGAHIAWLNNSYRTIAPLVKQSGQPFYWGVGTGYYRRGTAFIEPAWDYLHQLWMKAIEDGADNVVIWTWNDIDEDHDIMPSTLKGSALLELNSLYAAWYKNGSFPTLTEDRIFLSYPLCDGGRKAPGGGEAITWPNLNYFAWMTAPAILHVPGIGSVALEKGLNVGQLGKTIPGFPEAYTLERDGTVTMRGTVPHPMEKSTPEDPEFMQYRWVSLHE